ncbi:restriction endonuclease-like protein [Priestia taiwanensis]|uniref:DUF2357 domain-containing protein n=1 Tax=Priestia taiwanensis TaxID=1347902 RepID=A0A917AI54_9BACI|nr:restriction endonuclease-like protein [Priestia taiwanensis]MBM7361510.1 putative component of viral defense system (DUF524 family) [Priestia taiwanensis]GGE54748.1 hypothetical protein GCM10007140_01320 [Priestia taiwanensis]
MTALPLSGSNNEIELVKVETKDLSLIIKGNPYHGKFESLKSHHTVEVDEMMYFHVAGEMESVLVYDTRENKLVLCKEHPPIFFENRSYQVVVIPKKDQKLSFYHEHPLLRKAISPSQLGALNLLMGNISFPNEVGHSTFEIRSEGMTLLAITIEVFPSKIDYKADYRVLLEEVNDEIYNLAFHILKRTYLGASTMYANNPSKAEFYRILKESFHKFMKAIAYIKRQPHHVLATQHRLVPGEKIRRLDSVGMNYLRQRPYLFQGTETNKIPIKGITAYKEISYDTVENRFIKWMIERISHKIDDLQQSFQRNKIDKAFMEHVNQMTFRIKSELQDPFWRNIGKMDRSVFSLVIQMGAGYREAYQIFLMLSRGLTLRGQIFKMSVKDVARLYEYWTYLKLGQLLSKKYTTVHQDIVIIRQDGLYVALDESSTAKRKFLHPETKEVIELYFQKRNRSLPTVAQKPDTMLAIEKKGKGYQYQYIFDAKYRIDFAEEGSFYKREYGSPGPMEEDINTMHRYRDALVADNNGPFERTAYGAYVLFPWNQEEVYETHPFYNSIEKVNIGGFPFLPNATRLVEEFLDHLIGKNPDQIIEEGILPRGVKEEWTSSIDEKVLVGVVKNEKNYMTHKREGFYHIPLSRLKPGWQEAKYVALYAPKKWYKEKGGIRYVAKIKSVQVKKRNKIHELPSNKVEDYVYFELFSWQKLDHLIHPVAYGIQVYTMTNLALLKEVQELPELFMKSREERILWKILRRFTKKVRIELDHTYLDHALAISYYSIQGVLIKIDYERRIVRIGKEPIFTELTLDTLTQNSSLVFKAVLQELDRNNVIGKGGTD